MGLQPNVSSNLGDFISSVTRSMLAQAWEGIREMLLLSRTGRTWEICWGQRLLCAGQFQGTGSLYWEARIIKNLRSVRHKLIQNKLNSMQGNYLSNVVNEIQFFCRNLQEL